MNSNRWWTWYLWALLFVAGVLHVTWCVQAAFRQTPTVDEYAHLPAGLSQIAHGTFDLYGKNPPLIKLWMAASLHLPGAPDVQVPQPQGPMHGWGPWIYGTQFESANSPLYFDIYTWARLSLLIFSLGTAALLVVWLRPIAGWPAALVASGGFLLSPTVLAHSSLATVDVGASALIFLTCFLTHRWRSQKSAWAVAGVSAAAGFALAAKFTGVFLIPWILIWLVLRPVSRRTRLAWAGLATLVFTFVLGASYGFQDWGSRQDDFHFASTKMKTVTSFLPDAWRWPLPGAFLRGFDAQLEDTERGEFGSYLLGEWSERGWLRYNPLAFLMKESIPILSLLLLVPLAWWRRREGAAAWFIPSLCIAIPLLALNALQIGVRYLLPLYPFYFLVAGLGFSVALKRWPRVGAPLVATLFVVSAALADLPDAPDFLTFFNRVATSVGPKEDLLLDSNLDWGQDLYRLREEVGTTNEPIWLLAFGHVSPLHYGLRFQLVPEHPVSGLLWVSPNFVKGLSYWSPAPDGTWVWIKPDHLAWLRSEKPVARVGAWLVYDTRPKGEGP